MLCEGVSGQSSTRKRGKKRGHDTRYGIVDVKGRNGTGERKGEEGTPRGEGGDDAGLGNGDLLLLHGLEEGVVGARELVQLVDAAHALGGVGVMCVGRFVGCLVAWVGGWMGKWFIGWLVGRLVDGCTESGDRGTGVNKRRGAITPPRWSGAITWPTWRRRPQNK